MDDDDYIEDDYDYEPDEGYYSSIWGSAFSSMFGMDRRRRQQPVEVQLERDAFERINEAAERLMTRNRVARERNEAAARKHIEDELAYTLVQIRELQEASGVTWRRDEDGNLIAVVS